MVISLSTIIYSARPGYIKLARYLQANQDIVQVSLISTLEVLGFNKLTTRDKRIFETYFGSVRIFPLNDVIEAIRLRQQRKRSLGDSIIAATALLYNQPVLTNNVADFAAIDGLRVISLAEIPNA